MLTSRPAQCKTLGCDLLAQARRSWLILTALAGMLVPGMLGVDQK